ncbi:uncharacterized protein LOC110683134 [Chenopodium quinoa]|uniref:uncharacterized protein LOC110683134 n=1 Tax=Chenopodium quinoa TaxID=63459 RepID=UPI000B78654C|nr:uncharacterized protein LOC110683134 [Chenopodium quinoa]
MQRRCSDFSNWVENRWIDLGCLGTEHSWARGNSPNTYKSAKLDRGFANEEWRLKFDEGVVRNLPRVKSNHCLILISTNGFAHILTACKPFRFQAMWINHANFDDFVHKNWNNAQPLISFLKEFAETMFRWNREIFYNIFRKKSEL